MGGGEGGVGVREGVGLGGGVELRSNVKLFRIHLSGKVHAPSSFIKSIIEWNT